MYKLYVIVMAAISIIMGISSYSASDPLISAIKGLESTLFLLVALACLLCDDKRGNK